MRRTDNKLLILIALMVGLIAVVFSCSNPEDPADTEAPMVTLMSPTDASEIPNTVDVVAEATDNEAVTKVEFYIDAQLYATDNKAPWSCLWTLATDESGEHNVFAKAYDAAGNTDCSDLATVTCVANPPAAVSDFAASVPDMDGSLTLTWTAPGDDGTTGTAAIYDIRYYWYEITTDSWLSATELEDEPVPQAAGSDESLDVTGLNRSTTYYFAIRTQDAFGNWSDVSNNAEVTTRDLFAAAVSFDIGVLGTALTGSDFDDDSDVDLAVSHSSVTNNVSVLLNNGDGTYATPTVYDAGYAGASLIPTDVDEDGDLDLAITSSEVNFEVIDEIDTTITIDTNFVPDPIEIDTTWGFDTTFDSVSVVSMMLNDGNGLLELQVLDTYDTGYVFCLMPVYGDPWTCDRYGTEIHDTNSTYNPITNLDLLVVDTTSVRFYADENPVSIQSADLDGDGIADLAVVNNTSVNVSILFGNGDGTYQDPVNYGTGYSYPSSICIGDFNGDGLQDVANTNFGPSNVSVFLNLGGGVFDATPSIYPVDDAPNSISAADLDNDGDIDMAVANTGTGVISVLYNNGDGTFANRDGILLAGREAIDVAIADLTGDGTLDIVVANYEDDNVSVIINEGEFMFYSHNTVTFDVGDGPRSLHLADFDADGDTDIAVLNDLSNTISILLNCIVE